MVILSKQRDKSVNEFDGYDPLPALTCWGSMGKTNGPGIHNGSRGPSQAPWCIVAGQTHGNCQNCWADCWCWGGHTPQSEDCRPAAYWSPQKASSGREKRQNSWRGNNILLSSTQNKTLGPWSSPQLHLCTKKPNLKWLDVKSFNISPYSKCCILSLIQSPSHTHIAHSGCCSLFIHREGFILGWAWRHSLAHSPLSCPDVPLRDSQTTNPQLRLRNTQTSFKAKVDTLQPSCVTSTHWTASV